MRKQQYERRIPIVTAVFAIAIFGILTFGVAAFILSHFANERVDGDTALHLDGTWETVGPTYNDEHIVFIFNGNTFASVTEMIIYDANEEIIDDIRKFYYEMYAARVYFDDMSDGNFFLRITMDGTFGMYDGYIVLVSGESHLLEFPFSWDGAGISINGDLFRRN